MSTVLDYTSPAIGHLFTRSPSPVPASRQPNPNRFHKSIRLR